MSEPSTPTKRSASSSPTLPKSSTKKSKPNNPKSKAGNTPKKENASTDRKTPKHIYAEMIFEAGLRALNKAEVQEATGLSKGAQQDLIRKDKGSLWKAFGAFCAGL